MRILIRLLKDLLRKNNLNDTCSGGVGSFLIFNLVYAYFLHLKRNYTKEKSQNSSKSLNNFINPTTENKNNSNNFSLKFNKAKTNYYSSDDDSYEILTDEGTNSNPLSSNSDVYFNDSSIKFGNNGSKVNVNNEEFSGYFENKSSEEKDKMDLEDAKESQIKINDNNALNVGTEEKEKEILYGNVGKLFLGFLKFYVFEFDYDKFGISNTGEGKFFLKKLNADMRYSDSIIWVENITDKTHNISRGTKKFPTVLGFFRSIYYNLKAKKPESLDNNLMEKIANLSY